jgi:hypothetical protein
MSQLLVASSMSHDASEPSNGHAYSPNHDLPPYDDFAGFATQPSTMDSFQPSFEARHPYDNSSYSSNPDASAEQHYSGGQQPG